MSRCLALLFCVNDLCLHQAKQWLPHTDLPIFGLTQDVGVACASLLIRLLQQRDRTMPEPYRYNRCHSAHP